MLECNSNEFMSARAWHLLYRMIIRGFKCPKGERFRTSEFALLASYYGVPRLGDLVVSYSHCVLCIAVNAGREVFGSGLTV